MQKQNKWRHRFRGQVCRWTAPRQAIVDLLSRTKRHLSAKDIYTELTKIYPGLGLTTVYRTLDLLSRSGMIQTIAIGDGQNRYELKSGNKSDHHHHLICTNCGKIIDYREFLKEELEFINKAEKKLENKFSFKIMDHNIEFIGLCKNCQ